jgi:hypothetical protein
MGNRYKVGFGVGIGQVTSAYSAPNLTGNVYDASGTAVVGATVKIWKATSLPVDTSGAAAYTITSGALGAYSQNVGFSAGVANYWAVKATIASDVVTSGGSSPVFAPVHFDGTATVRITSPGVWKTADVAQYTVSAVTSGAVTALTANSNAHYEPGVVQTLTRTSGTGSAAVITATAGSDGVLDASDYSITSGGASHSVGTSIFTTTRNTLRFVFGWSGKLNTFNAGDFLFGFGPVAAQATGGTTIRISATGVLNISFPIPNLTTQHNEFQVSIDLTQATAAAGVVVVLNGAVITPTYTTWNQNVAVNMAGALIGIGCNTAGSAVLEHELDYCYLASGYAAIDNSTGQLLDLTQASNVARFGSGLINQVDGTGPTGRQPAVLALGPYDALQTSTTFNNKGRGNNGVVSGTLTVGS